MTTTSQLRSLMARSQSRCDLRYKAMASCPDAPPCRRARSRCRRARRGLWLGLERRERRHEHQRDGEHQRRHGQLASPAEGRAAAGRGVRLVKVGDFDSPLYVTAPPGDRRRIFVVEQAGQIVVVRGGKPVAKPFLDIRSKVTAGGEQGLLSMAFAPDYAQSGLLLRLLHREERDRGDLGVPPRQRRQRQRRQRAARAAHGRPRAQPQRRPDGLRARQAACTSAPATAAAATTSTAPGATRSR